MFVEDNDLNAINRTAYPEDMGLMVDRVEDGVQKNDRTETSRHL